MKQHKATAKWSKGLKDGSGELHTGNGTVKATYSYDTRFGEAKNGTTPDELVAAALASCFSMFLSALVGKENLTPDYIQTEATLTLGEKDGGPHVMKIELVTEASIPNIEEDTFQKLVQDSKAKCPISKALAAVPEITVQATLKN